MIINCSFSESNLVNRCCATLAHRLDSSQMKVLSALLPEELFEICVHFKESYSYQNTVEKFV